MERYSDTPFEDILGSINNLVFKMRETRDEEGRLECFTGRGVGRLRRP